MEQFFESIFSQGDMKVGQFFLSILVALIAGIIFSFMCYYKSRSSKNFLVATSLLPMTVAMVIILVNGNIGVGVAVAGAFGLVRFRSAQGTAKEIAIIFITMAAGLAFGMGYLAYGSIFLILAGVILIVLAKINIWEVKIDEKAKILRITIPENLDYTNVFTDLLERYTSESRLLKVKSTNLGSMFRLTYEIKLRDVKEEKEFIDQIRCRNGNLEVSLEREEFDLANL